MAKNGKLDYEGELRGLQIELNRIAQWVQDNGKRVLVLIEGRDTAGKGGAISALRAHMNDRWCRTVALGKPSELESTQWYFQRYLPHLPAAGEFVFFDRSWYNRAGVEKVMGFCTQEQCSAFLAQVPVLEKLLVEDGVMLFKYWLTVDQEKQEERFRERLDDPLKQWKLSPVDIRSREKYEDYTAAREAMLKASHKRSAPWTLVDFNNQKLGRLNLIRHFVEQFPKDRPAFSQPEYKALAGKLHKEKFSISPKPIKSYY